MPGLHGDTAADGRLLLLLEVIAMPSSGYPSANLTQLHTGTVADAEKTARIIRDCAVLAHSHGLLVEWLEAFVGCWEVTKDARLAARAGLIEWDM